MSETVHVEFDLTVPRPVNSKHVGDWLYRNPYGIWTISTRGVTIENVTVSERAIVLDAIVALLNAEDNAGSFTCGEAEMIARFMRAYGRADDAARWLAVHARSDNDEFDEHHDLYLAQQVQR